MGREILLFAQNRRGEDGGGRPYQQSRLLKKRRSSAARPLGLKDDSAFLPAAVATSLETQHQRGGERWGGNHNSKILSSVITGGSTDAENKKRKRNG